MMMSEFIERTKFEPTYEEYREIEEQYYQFDGNKDQFCKQWVRKGGIQRLSRERVRKIEALEKQIAKIQEEVDWYHQREVELCTAFNQERKQRKMAEYKLESIGNAIHNIMME
jgi:hypothetical protein